MHLHQNAWWRGLLRGAASLRTALVLTVVVGVSVPAGVTSYQNRLRLEQQFDAQLKRDLVNTSELLALSVQAPLWNVNPAEAQAIITAHSVDERVVSIEVFDKLGRPFASHLHADRDLQLTQTVTRTVQRDGRELGTLTLRMDSAPYARNLDDALKHEVQQLLQTLLGSLVLLLVMLQIRLVRPVRRLVVASNKLENGDLGTPIARGRMDELGQLARGMEASRRGLAQLFAEREQVNHHLETLVKQRTAELIEKNRQLEILSVSDRLTGLYNRLRLDQVLQEELARHERRDSTFSVILIDVDHFKSVNDLHGHLVGDQVLVRVAQILKDGVRELDVVGRWGGEEFMVVCRDTGLDGTGVLAEKLRTLIARDSFPVAGSVCCSFGVASLRPHESVEALIGRADKLLYDAKRNGRNRVEAQ